MKFIFEKWKQYIITDTKKLKGRSPVDFKVGDKIEITSIKNNYIECSVYRDEKIYRQSIISGLVGSDEYLKDTVIKDNFYYMDNTEEKEN